MKIEHIFTGIAILLTVANTILLYYNYRHTRRKDFQDRLYQLKIDTYKALVEQCHKVYKRLDINSSPFVEIYEFNNEDEWEKYCIKNMNELFLLGFELEDAINKNSLILPAEVIGLLHDFTGKCLSFVTQSYHFDTGLIIENQDRLTEDFFDLVNAFRIDLKIDEIDKGLMQRISNRI